MSEKRIANNEEELIKFIQPELELQDIESINKIIFNDITINYKFNLRLSKKATTTLSNRLHQDINDYNIIYTNCIFKEKVYLTSHKVLKENINCNKEIKFSKGVIFEKDVFLYNPNTILIFEFIKFKEKVILNNSTFNCKIRFRKCKFKSVINFNNTTFNNLADFWRCKFYQKTIFYKTDFNNTAVFSGVTFKENVLFTYTLIDKLLLLRGAIAEKGFDLSLAIISGELGLFDFNLDDFKTIDVNKYVNSQLKGRKFKTNQDKKEAYIEIYENKYEKSVSENAEIPTKNKRETYRIIKQNHEKQNNVVASLDFKKLEKNTLLDELRLRNFSFTNRANRFILWLNKWSNNYGTSILRSLILIFVIGSIPFFFSIMETDIFHYSWSLDWESFKTGVKYYTQYLIPTHKTNYVGNTNPTIGYFIFDFIGRIIIGYGIYQFIQAFRKYR